VRTVSAWRGRIGGHRPPLQKKKISGAVRREGGKAAEANHPNRSCEERGRQRRGVPLTLTLSPKGARGECADVVRTTVKMEQQSGCTASRMQSEQQSDCTASRMQSEQQSDCTASRMQQRNVPTRVCGCRGAPPSGGGVSFAIPLVQRLNARRVFVGFIQPWMEGL
jgi:hypothetical protein